MNEANNKLPANFTKFEKLEQSFLNEEPDKKWEDKGSGKPYRHYNYTLERAFGHPNYL